MDSRGFWSDSNGKGSTIDISPESLSKHLSFYVGVVMFDFCEGFAGKGQWVCGFEGVLHQGLTCEASTLMVMGSEGSKYQRVVSLMTATLTHWKAA